MKCCSVKIALLLLILFHISAQNVFETAGKILGLDKSSGIAQLVSETFGTAGQKTGDAEGGQNIFSGFLRVLGFDTKKIAAIAVNGVIFLAQIINSLLTNQHSRRKAKVKQGTPLDWLMSSKSVQHLMSAATDRDLPDKVINYVKERSLDEDTGCVQLLICKGAPLVWGMQRALKYKPEEQLRGKTALFGYFPSVEEVAEYADECENKHPYCFFLDS